ncbi:hypothetical protein TSAR_007511 [Trichomalopsis sarcophagae]|uniref:Uncharacterized protein n=1 Tax=Trichomalopsis sarcophagae TaxID=543379 RepID=A0A232EI30_9HYME|nr:hypothetical protein TSAR_007511 [Trichomalopsis sarcophagae]
MERDRVASTPRLPNSLALSPTCDSSEEDKPRETAIRSAEQSNTNIANSEKPEQKRNKDCILKLTLLEEEPRRKRAKVENRFVLVDNQPNLSIPAEILIGWITWFWKSPATRGIEFKRPSIKNVQSRSISKKQNDKIKKSVKNTETEEEKTKRRERDRIRKSRKKRL